MKSRAGIRRVRVADMDKQFASELIAAALQTAQEALNSAVAISEQSGVSFELPWGGEGSSESGMGATYLPEGHPRITNGYDNYWGWNPSAGTC